MERGIKWFYINKSEIQEKINAGVIDSYDVIFAKDTHEMFVVREDLSLFDVTSKSKTYLNVSEAETSLNEDDSAYVGELVSILDSETNEYQAYVVNKDSNDRFIVSKVSSSSDLDDFKKRLLADEYSLGYNQKNISEVTLAGLKNGDLRSWAWSIPRSTLTGSEINVTNYGITITIQLDKNNNVVGLLLNGTSTRSFMATIGDSFEIKPDVKYILNGGAEGNTEEMSIIRVVGSKSYARVSSASDEAEFIGTDAVSAHLALQIYSNITFNDILFKPMLRLDGEDATFEPCYGSAFNNIMALRKNLDTVEWVYREMTLASPGERVRKEYMVSGTDIGISDETGNGLLILQGLSRDDYTAVFIGQGIYHRTNETSWTVWATKNYVDYLFNSIELDSLDIKYFSSDTGLDPIIEEIASGKASIYSISVANDPVIEDGSYIAMVASDGRTGVITLFSEWESEAEYYPDSSKMYRVAFSDGQRMSVLPISTLGTLVAGGETYTVGNNGVMTIPNATPSKDGFMSSSDKTLLKNYLMNDKGIGLNLLSWKETKTIDGLTISTYPNSGHLALYVSGSLEEDTTFTLPFRSDYPYYSYDASLGYYLAIGGTVYGYLEITDDSGTHRTISTGERPIRITSKPVSATFTIEAGEYDNEAFLPFVGYCELVNMAYSNFRLDDTRYESYGLCYPFASSTELQSVIEGKLNQLPSSTPNNIVVVGADGKSVSDSNIALNTLATKEEVENAVNGIFVPVDSLPNPSADTMGKIYLVPNEGSALNVRDEYVTIRSGQEGSYSYSWELFGSTEIDIDGYVPTDRTIAGIDLEDNITKAELLNALDVDEGAQVNVQPDWNQNDNTADDYIKNKPNPANDGVLTITRNNTEVGTFSANQASNETINIEVPTQPSDIGLGNVDNTSDLNKPISTATQAALNAKQDTLTFDSVPTTGSTNPVTSDGIAASYSSLSNGISYAHQRITEVDSAKLDKSEKGSNGGVAELDSAGKVPSSQLPSYVDDVLEYSSTSDFPATGETGKIYVDATTNKTYRWGGSEYVEISESLALGETSSTAYRGDRGKTAYDHSQIASGNPHGTTYGDLPNKPSINDVELSGNKTASDLGLMNHYDIDTAPTESSENLITSGGVWTADKGIKDRLQGSKQASSTSGTIEISDYGMTESIDMYFKPTQDLHGYDNPWAGGAGKNKLPYFTAEEKDGIRLTYDDGVVVLDGTSSANAFFTLSNLNLTSNDYVFSANNDTVNNGVHISLREIGASSDFADLPMNDTDKHNIYQNVSIGQVTLYVLSGTQLTNFRLPLQIEVGSEKTDFEPYSNICPISGQDNATFEWTGKNLFGGTYDEFFPLHFNVDTVVVASCDEVSGDTPQIAFYDENENQLDYWGMSTEYSAITGRMARSFTLPKEAYFVKFINAEAQNYQIEIASENTAYTRYVHGERTMNFGNTYYGGYCQFNGQIYSEWVLGHGADYNWGFNGSLGGYLYARTTQIPKAYGTSNIMSDKLSNNGSDSAAIVGRSNSSIVEIKVPTSIASDMTEFNNWMTNENIQICYKLATPSYVRVTPPANLNLTDDYPIEYNGYMASIGYQPKNTVLAEAKRYTNQAIEGLGLPKPPTTDGTYHLECSVSGGIPTIRWVLNSGGGDAPDSYIAIQANSNNSIGGVVDNE